MTPRDFVRTLLRGYAAILIALVIAVVVAVVVLATQPREYRAASQVRVEVELPSEASVDALEAAADFADFQTVTFKALVLTDPVLTDVIRSEDLGVSADELAAHVSPVAAADTSLIEIRVTWPDAEDAASIANALAQRLIDEEPDTAGDVAVTLTQAKEARPSTVAVTPNPALTIGLAVFAALVVSAAWLFVRRLRRMPSTGSES